MGTRAGTALLTTFQNFAFVVLRFGLWVLTGIELMHKETHMGHAEAKNHRGVHNDFLSVPFMSKLAFTGCEAV